MSDVSQVSRSDSSATTSSEEGKRRTSDWLKLTAIVLGILIIVAGIIGCYGGLGTTDLIFLETLGGGVVLAAFFLTLIEVLAVAKPSLPCKRTEKNLSSSRSQDE